MSSGEFAEPDPRIHPYRAGRVVGVRAVGEDQPTWPHLHPQRLPVGQEVTGLSKVNERPGRRVLAAESAGIDPDLVFVLLPFRAPEQPDPPVVLLAPHRRSRRKPRAWCRPGPSDEGRSGAVRRNCPNNPSVFQDRTIVRTIPTLFRNSVDKCQHNSQGSGYTMGKEHEEGATHSSYGGSTVQARSVRLRSRPIRSDPSSAGCASTGRS